jgi:flavin reductase (DIM6/NTAB) family NADH-FMN oxidoreductase RutF
MAAPNLDQIDTILRLVDREVWIVTSAAAGNRGGLTATWVAPASIDAQRPVLLVGIAPNHFTAELIEESHAFVAHLLRVDQTSLAFDFARDSGRQRDKLTGLEFASAVTGVPVLRDCLAWLDCRVFAQYDAGDRLFFGPMSWRPRRCPAGRRSRSRHFLAVLPPKRSKP